MIKPKVLFVCTENSCRSQIAEGFLRHLAGDRFDIVSAGAYPTKLNTAAVEVMKEIGIDISGQHAKDVAQFLGQTFQYLIRVCTAREKCPERNARYFPARSGTSIGGLMIPPIPRERPVKN
jgi:arsenate reductase